MGEWGPAFTGPHDPSPACEAELLSLLLDIIVVALRTISSAGDAGTDLNGDLLEVRALDRGHELESRADVAVIEELLQVAHSSRQTGGQRAALHHVRSGRRDSLGLHVARVLRSQPGHELLGRVELVALGGRRDVVAVRGPRRKTIRAGIVARLGVE